MSVNPYESHRSHDDTTPSTPKLLIGIGAGTIAFMIGLAWLKFQRLTPEDVNPSLYITAELVAYCGILASIVLGAGAAVSALIARLTSPSTASTKSFLFGWNIAPALLSVVIGVGWGVLGLLGVSSLLIQLPKWDFYTGLPVRELVFQTVLFSSGIAACVYCLIAGRHWMRTTYRHAFLYSGLGFIGPLVAYVILFPVCDNLIRYLI